jgi:hypothetical protein
MGRRVTAGPTLVLIVLCLSAGPIYAQKRKAAEPAETDLARYDARIKPEDRRHWAFQPVRQPRLPQVRDRAWVRSPIDAFVLANLEAEGWKPNPAAEQSALLRRVHLDLAGLPPTLAEQDAFIADPSPGALDRVIDGLLARPSYGERWGRHWLDLVRYAETNGYERDAERPFVWRYRDYVIRALNDDKPFNRFVLEQLAGDDLPDADADTLIATGFYRLGPWDDEPPDPQEDRFDQLDDMVSTASLAFLGLTLGCARCHDHKFEALTMHDYYRLVAVFNGLKRPQAGRTELVLPAGPRQKVAVQQRRDRDAAALKRLGSAWNLVSPRTPAGAFAAQAATLVRRSTPDLPLGYFMVEDPSPPATHLLLRGKTSRPGPKVEPGVPAVLVERQPLFPSPGKHGSSRRLTVARWIADPANPLTARVIVNRVWQHHFGEGLVRTASDFGVMGQPPTHPELLDWLAGWFVEHGWSLKKLHRLIMTSNTYRMSKRSNRGYAASDPENALLWRFPYRRLEVEAIRDSALAASGQLNPKMYGPSMYPQVPRDALAGSSDPDQIWRPFNEREAARRTIYAFIKRSLVVPMLEVLDVCDTTRSADKRLVTTVAPQALTLFNGDFVNRQARHFAQRLVEQAGVDVRKQIELAYRLALSRPPTARERQTMLRFLRDQTENLLREAEKRQRIRDTNGARHKALEQMCRVIFNLNEFVYAD